MSFLGKLFGKKDGGETVESAVQKLLVIYDDPEVKSEGGVGVVGRTAEEVRGVGRGLARSGGKEAMVAAQDALRQKFPWAATNVDSIWASIPEWRG